MNKIGNLTFGAGFHTGFDVAKKIYTKYPNPAGIAIGTVAGIGIGIAAMVFWKKNRR